MLLLCTHPVWAGENLQLYEYQIKVGLLNKLPRVIYWPEDSTIKKHLHLCVLGEDPFEKSLDKVVAKDNAERKLQQQVRYISLIRNIAGCHMVYISDSEKYRLTSILDDLRGEPVLTVSSIKNFAYQGGMIEFFRKKQKISFRVALSSLRTAGLTADANFLRFVEIVETTGAD